MGSEARTRVALWALLVITLFSFGQVFDRGSWPGPALLGMLLAGSIAAGARRLGIGTGWTAGASLIGLVWYCAVVFRIDDLFYGLPTLDAIDGLGRAIRSAYSKSSIDYAPVPVRPGYVLLEVIGMWTTTTIAEIATFRWRRPLVAAIPPIALFSLLAVVGTRTGTTFLVLAFIAALLSYLALESSHRLRAWGSWVRSVGDRTETPADVSNRLAKAMGASCLAAALFAPVFLPALGDGLLDWRNDNGTGAGSGTGGAGGEIDLLASLQPRLLNQSETEMIEVSAPTADYWRLTSLVAFDGAIWRPLAEEPQPMVAGNAVVANRPPRLYEGLTQRIRIRGLEGSHLPAASQPDTVTLIPPSETGAAPGNLTFQPETATIQLQQGLSSGLAYEVTSLVPRPSFVDLKKASIGRDLPGVYLDPGPVPVSPEVDALIASWTDRFDNPFRKLVAVQDNLRIGYQYAVDVPASASADHLSEFLLTTRRGYCQQFAAAFALIARRLGFPTRVSVGFLPGSADVAEPGRFTVRGSDAHAWPEVYFDDYGWVRFEPTPGNAAAPPGYTSRRIPFEAQNPFSDTGTRGNRGGPGNLQGNQNVPTGGRDRGGPVESSPRREQTGPSRWEQAFARLVTLLLVGSLAFIACVPSLKALRAWMRYRRATTPSAMAAAAFAHFEEGAGDLTGARGASESATRFARRVSAACRLPAEQTNELAAIYERSAYSRDGVDAHGATRARRLAVALRGRLWEEAGWWQRAKRLFSPQQLLSR